jgi:photosystem II stability/assembly factor-like uncharacterized protein
MRGRTMTAAGVAAALTATAVVAAGGATAAAPKPAKTVKGSLVTAVPKTLKPGTKVANSRLGNPRVFVNGQDGFALAAGEQAQYAAATTDGGKTWTTVSPALHVDALQAPLSVTQIGAASTKVAYAFGSGQVADVTSDGGKHWYRALFQGTVMAIVPGFSHQLFAYVDSFGSGSGLHGPTLQYVSKNGGKTWTYSTGVGA